MIAASRPLPAAVRYGTSLAVVLAVHALAITVALNWESPQPVPPPPPVMLMELAPLSEPEPVPPPPVVQPPKPVEEPTLPKLAEAPKPVIEVPKPKPKPKPQPPKPQPKVEPPKEVQPVQEPAPARPAEPVKAPPAPPAPAPAPAPAASTPSWEGEVLGRLARFKKYPPAARSRGTQGQVVIAFTLDGQGRVLDANVDKSSGSSLLDRAALAAVREAQPLPVPPADRLRNGTITLRAPFTFNLTKG